VRRRALACVRWAIWCGWSRERAAAALGLSTAALADWQRRWDDPNDRLAAHALGAKPMTCSALERTAVLDFLAMHGTALGVAILQDHFPLLARRDLACLLHLARSEADAVAAGGHYRCVTWHDAGRAWAMDHTEPPTPIDGACRWVLTVRDLASGCTLAATAVEHPDAASTIHILRALFAQHGAPLVLKADNGGAFIADETVALLAAHRVALLRSPAYTPTYNGACEAGNGTIKHLAHQLACRHDRPEHWTCDDLEGARLLANRRITDRDRTDTPEHLFATRTAITDIERDRLHRAITGEQQRRTDDAVIASNHGLRTFTPDALVRQAIAAALSGTGVITIRSKRLRLSRPQHEVG
jgi:transposase InsO family protein